MKPILMILLLAFSVSCGKITQDMATEPDAPWLAIKKGELAGCTCRTTIHKGKFNGAIIYEIKVVDPLCNGVDIVYNADGVALFNSGQATEYGAYTSGVTELSLIWDCSRNSE